MKTREDNIVTIITSAIYAKNDPKLSWLIGLGVNSDQN